MYLKDMPLQTLIAPLTQVTVVVQVAPAVLAARDGRGRLYFRCEVPPASLPVQVTFQVGGALGIHTLTLEGVNTTEMLQFRVAARTRLAESSGQFSELLDLLYRTMTDEPMPHLIHYQGRTYYFFVPWLRDHVHTLKGMKYFDGRLYDGIDLYRDSQREDGMIWDNVHRRTPPGLEANHWGKRFQYGGFERTFADGTAQFTRIPVENDVEYLFVEGLYYTWKATADDGWMASCLDAAIRAYEYSVASPYRWSSKYGLLKRGHTIDTWDFQSDTDCLSDFAGWPDPMAIHPEKTRFGVMFGDNTGYAVGCDYLAEMLQVAGREEEARFYRQRGADIRKRLDDLCWNGRFFTHHVPEDPWVVRDVGVDEATQISLSNAYSLNRGIRPEQAAAILQTYQALKKNLPPGSPGEWYTIYPPFQRGYGGHNAVWQYMNASVTPIVAGELARGAFTFGQEAYGVDILRRVLALAQPTRYLHCSYTGAYPPPPRREFTPLRLSAWANVDVSLLESPEAPDWQAQEHPNLAEFPTGVLNFEGVPFHVEDGRRGAIAVSDRAGYLRQVEIPISARAGCIYFLHTLARVRSGVGGMIVLKYADGSSYSTLVKEGENALVLNHWGYPELQYDKHDKRRAVAVWRMNHPQHLNMQVTAYGLDHPHPEKEIRSLVLKSVSETGADGGTMWFVLGLTLSDAPVYFPPEPVSFGIPDQWGAAAVVYALLEGLAGVVDAGTAYRRVNLSPRWAAAGVEQVEAVVHYPASDGYLAYHYRRQPDNAGDDRIWLEVTGSGDVCECHLLWPANTGSVETVLVDGRMVPFTICRVADSSYVDFILPLPGPAAIEIRLLHHDAGETTPEL